MAIQTLDLNPRRVALPGWSLLNAKVKEQGNGEHALTLVHVTPAAPVTPPTAGCPQALTSAASGMVVDDEGGPDAVVRRSGMPSRKEIHTIKRAQLLKKQRGRKDKASTD